MFYYLFMVLYFYLIIVNSDELNTIPVTFYLGELGNVNTNPSTDYMYYAIKPCDGGIGNQPQASLAIGTPENINLTNLLTEPWIAVQVSKCEASFTVDCIIATNYYWDTLNPKAVPIVTWNMNNEPAYYIRVLGVAVPTRYTLELTFTDGLPITGFNYTSDQPFSGNTVSKTPVSLQQYWKSESIFSVPNFNMTHFSIVPCQQSGETINSINVAIASPINKVRSAFFQWACPISVQPYTSCTALTRYWRSVNVCPFSFLECEQLNGMDPTDGITVGVEGDGAEIDGLNYFTVQATVIATFPPSIKAKQN